MPYHTYLVEVDEVFDLVVRHQENLVLRAAALAFENSVLERGEYFLRAVGARERKTERGGGKGEI